MLNKLKPTIAIVDSGIGGITVLNQLLEKYKSGNYIYYADNLYMPYGNMSKSALKTRLNQIIKILEDYKVDNIIIACNTASCVIDADNTQKIVTLQFEKEKTYLATSLTKKTLLGYNVIECQNLAKQIEENIFNKPKLEKLILSHVKKYKLNKLKSFVLGCTHYELIKDIFKKYCPNTKIECNSKFIIDKLNLNLKQEDTTIHFILSKPNLSYYEKLVALTYKQGE